jgi:hypothetical protein
MLKTVAIAGALAQKPRQAGHTWQFLQYLLGFRKLGWQVLFIDRLEPEMCVDETAQPCSLEDSINLRYFREVMGRFGLGNSFALLYDRGRQCFGLPRDRLLEQVGASAFLLNVMGFLTDEEVLGRAPLRVFLDTDPGFSQMWQDLGLADLLRGHDRYVTIAENIGRPGCTIPTCGIDWITWRQPVVLEQWPAQTTPPRHPFTSIGSWRGPYGPVEHGGRQYGLRVHEFRGFARLPAITGARFEVALDIHSAEVKDIELLESAGWDLVDPKVVARSPDVYRDYIQTSRAEFMATKNMYVQSRSGWFSERSICYLASGRPVLAQDTGLDGLYPVGEGLLTFRTLEEAAAAVEEINAHYQRHSRAAREIAEACFHSDKILTDLLGKLGLA